MKKMLFLCLTALLLFGTITMAVLAAETKTDVRQLAQNYVRDIPEDAFGGIYYNEEGQLIVHIKEGCQVDIAVPLSGEVIVDSVQYSLAELEAMKEALEPYMLEYHIVTLDADEVHNTVAVEVNQYDGRIDDLIDSLDNIDSSIVEITVLPEDYIIEYTVKHIGG